MNYWIVTDTHLGHKNMEKYCNRPFGFEKLILDNIRNTVSAGDILIHLGDVCIGNDSEWNRAICSFPATCWLVRGNHDKKSIEWYLDNGWCFVADSFTLNMYGMSILLSHKPKKDTGYGLNIHGHFHNTVHRSQKPEFLAIKKERQFLISMELENYKPVSLKEIVRRFKKNLNVGPIEKRCEMNTVNGPWKCGVCNRVFESLESPSIMYGKLNAPPEYACDECAPIIRKKVYGNCGINGKDVFEAGLMKFIMGFSKHVGIYLSADEIYESLQKITAFVQDALKEAAEEEDNGGDSA